jgi:hypothetical protein
MAAKPNRSTTLLRETDKRITIDDLLNGRVKDKDGKPLFAWIIIDEESKRPKLPAGTC